MYYFKPKENKIVPRKDPRKLQLSEELGCEELGTKALMSSWPIPVCSWDSGHCADVTSTLSDSRGFLLLSSTEDMNLENVKSENFVLPF